MKIILKNLHYRQRAARSGKLLTSGSLIVLLLSMQPSIAQNQMDMNQLVDISTPHVKAQGAAVENIRKGKEILQQALDRLGFEKWKGHSTLEIEAIDIWAKKNRWWPTAEQSFKGQYLLGTFTSRMELLDGDWKDQILGVQSWQGYKKQDLNSPLAKSSDPLLMFYLPSLQYFNELPFRLASAQFVTYAGEGKQKGKTYDLVYSTWGSLDANRDYDQFVLWIDRETSLVTMCHYTVRQAFPAAAGTIYYDSYKTLQGVTIPFKHFVLLEWPGEIRFPLEQNFFHRVEIRQAKFNAVPEGTLLPLSGLPEPRDWKPNVPISWEAK
ncbi:hypothetical protein L0222_22400 [bacterium]|nr:hypothetical protein [bacterium]MCI0605512.1 hypothetical protein [bacterium]